MYLYQATKDPYFLEVGRDMLESIEHSAKTPCGYASVWKRFGRGGGGGRCAGTQVVISQTVFSRNSVYRRACNHCTLRQKHWTVASFSPQPFSDVVLQVKIYRKKSQHHCSNTERGEQGSALLRGVQVLLTFNFFGPWEGRYVCTLCTPPPPPRPAYAPVL